MCFSDSPQSSLSAGHTASEFIWDNFTVRHTAESDSRYGQDETDVPAAGVLGAITPHPTGADTVKD